MIKILSQSKQNKMKEVKFIKVKSNEIDFDTMTLINIVSKQNDLVYIFICDFIQKFRNESSVESCIVEFNEDDFAYIQENYKIVK